MRGRWQQKFRPAGQTVLAPASIQAVLKQGDTKPHDSTIKRDNDRFRIASAGGTALAAPAVADGGAAEFDVAISGSGPWNVDLTWVGAGLSALAKGVFNRTITVTSAGATNSPFAINVKIIVL